MAMRLGGAPPGPARRGGRRGAGELVLERLKMARRRSLLRRGGTAVRGGWRRGKARSTACGWLAGARTAGGHRRRGSTRKTTSGRGRRWRARRGGGRGRLKLAEDKAMDGAERGGACPLKVGVASGFAGCSTGTAASPWTAGPRGLGVSELRGPNSGWPWRWSSCRGTER